MLTKIEKIRKLKRHKVYHLVFPFGKNYLDNNDIQKYVVLYNSNFSEVIFSQYLLLILTQLQHRNQNGCRRKALSLIIYQVIVLLQN